jgi:hypothetical protein
MFVFSPLLLLGFGRRKGLTPTQIPVLWTFIVVSRSLIMKDPTFAEVSSFISPSSPPHTSLKTATSLTELLAHPGWPVLVY